jgi:hypothetical protein
MRDMSQRRARFHAAPLGCRPAGLSMGIITVYRDIIEAVFRYDKVHTVYIRGKIYQHRG